MVAWADRVTVASATDRSLAVMRDTLRAALSTMPLSCGCLSAKVTISHLLDFTRLPVMMMPWLSPVASV